MSGAWKGYRRAEHGVESFIIRDYYSFIFFLSIPPFLDVALQVSSIAWDPIFTTSREFLYGLEYLAFSLNIVVQYSEGRSLSCVV
jgi:hypothetical protein